MDKQPNVQLDIRQEDVFIVESEPDLYKAKAWAGGNVTIRVIETVVGAYGAIDHRFGTTYFDVGDALVKLTELRTVVTIKKNEIDRLRGEE